jgi:hypothetical protein
MKIAREKLTRQPRFVDDDLKDSCVNIPSFEDNEFELKTLELDKGVQSVPVYVENSVQTLWRYPKSSTTQYEPRTMDENTINDILNKDQGLLNHLKASLPL